MGSKADSGGRLTTPHPGWSGWRVGGLYNLACKALTFPLLMLDGRWQPLQQAACWAAAGMGYTLPGLHHSVLLCFGPVALFCSGHLCSGAGFALFPSFLEQRQDVLQLESVSPNRMQKG